MISANFLKIKYAEWVVPAHLTQIFKYAGAKYQATTIMGRHERHGKESHE
jgi:hypothetical protein